MPRDAAPPQADPAESGVARTPRKPLTLADLLAEEAEEYEVPTIGALPPLFGEAAIARSPRTLPIPDLTRLARAWLLMGEGNTGKAQPNDSLVLTPVGFKTMGRLAVGDLVTCPDGTHAPVLGVFPQGEKEIFEIEFRDGRTIECCDEHLWQVWWPKPVYETGKSHAARKVVAAGQWRVVPTSFLREVFARKGHSPRMDRKLAEIGVPLVAPCALEMPAQTLPVPPYVLGALIGDGSVCAGVNFTTADQSVLDRLTAEMPGYELVGTGHNKGYDYKFRMKPALRQSLKHAAVETLNARNTDAAYTVVLAPDGHGYRRRVRMTTGSARGKPAPITCRGETRTLAEWARHLGAHRDLLAARLAQMTVEQALGFEPVPGKNTQAWASPLSRALKELGLFGLRSHEKFVPDVYKRGSVAQRLALLQGLLDTDGSVGPGDGTHATFSSTSERLARDVQEIAWSLGAVAKMVPRQTSYTHKGVKRPGRPSWRVSMVHPDISDFFSLPRKAASCRKRVKGTKLGIESIRPVGRKVATCISVGHPDRLYVTNNYVVTHNTTFARVLASKLFELDREAVLAAVAPGNRNLERFVENVMQPPGTDPRETAAWMLKLLMGMARRRRGGVLDGGGGDQATAEMIRAAPDLPERLEESGLALVAAHFLGPRIDDLIYLASHEAQGFRPRATALVLNLARAESPSAFDDIRRQPAYKAALDRGAVEVWLPALAQDVALAIERKGLNFAQARDGVSPEGRSVQPLGPLQRTQLRNWLAAVEAELAPIQTWLPWS